MNNVGTNRRLAAILAADVVGYSSMMEDDEAGTLTALNFDDEHNVSSVHTASPDEQRSGWSSSELRGGPLISQLPK